MLNFGHCFVSEEEKAQTEAGCFHPLGGSCGEGDCGPCAGAAASGREEKEAANSQGWHGNCDESQITEGEDCFSTVCHPRHRFLAPKINFLHHVLLKTLLLDLDNTQFKLF